VASYSAEFATELHRQFRMVIESDWYRQVFPATRWAKETGLELVTTKGGSRYAVSVGGSLTGRGGDLIIVDDPLNAAEAQSRRDARESRTGLPAVFCNASMTRVQPRSSW
jgi:hypothetical protein